MLECHKVKIYDISNATEKSSTTVIQLTHRTSL